MLTDNFSGTDLIKLSNKPPPVIFAAELIKLFFVSFKTSFVYILVGVNNSFFKKLFILIFF